MANIVYNEDCMIGMARYPDKYFDLAIVDPPYGLGDKLAIGGCKKPNRMQEMYLASKWEDVAPTHEYFTELFRVSQNQIIFGGNYFNLPPTRGIVVWDKIKFAANYSQVELAWTSFDCVARIFHFCSNGGFVTAPMDTKIHPTQKPIALYDWLIVNYAKDCKNILDTHVGSGSSRIAADKHKIDFTGFEIDAEYWQAQESRFERYKAQGVLF